MFKEMIRFSCLLYLSVISDFVLASDNRVLKGFDDVDHLIQASIPNLRKDQIANLYWQITSAEGKKITFMSANEFERLNGVCSVKKAILDIIEGSGYEGEATSPRAAITEVLARIKVLEEAAAASAPTAGGASAASE